MTAIETGLIEALRALPPHRVAEVATFIDFLRSREQELQATASTGQRSLAALFGLGKGAFASPEEVDQFIRSERQ